MQRSFASVVAVRPKITATVSIVTTYQIPFKPGNCKLKSSLYFRQHPAPNNRTQFLLEILVFNKEISTLLESLVVKANCFPLYLPHKAQGSATLSFVHIDQTTAKCFV